MYNVAEMVGSQIAGQVEANQKYEIRFSELEAAL
jgi:hypothetical protein